jgi:hypothetical protein
MQKKRLHMLSATKFNPAEFCDYYGEEFSERKGKALLDLSRDDRKKYEEWTTFHRFARVAELGIDPRTIAICDPPEPDICCQLSDEQSYFELGEVTDQGLAENAGIAAREGRDIFGGFCSQMDALRRMISQKCSKQYLTLGHPVHLLLHYRVGHQYPDARRIRAEIVGEKETIVGMLRASSFSNLWLYDGWEGSVIANVDGGPSQAEKRRRLAVAKSTSE